jgi:hypothetical protein
LFQKAIKLLKKRWPEVMLIVILQAAMMLLAEEVVTLSETTGSQTPALPFWAGFLLGMGMILCAVLWQMLYLGFLKTAAVFGTQPQQPMHLLQSGRPYFWRIFFFQVLLGFVLMVLNAVIVTVFSSLVFQNREFAQVPGWFTQICALIGILVVLKPMLLVPARIIVYDNSTVQAIFQMHFYQLKRIDQIFKVTFAGFAITLISVLPVALFEQTGFGYYIFSGLHHAVFSLVIVGLTLMAVLWIQEQLEAEFVPIDGDRK